MAKKNKQDNSVHIPACAGEFIRQVIKKMRYRKKIRRDVQSELVAHFEDEIKDCKTSEEKEQKARQLIDKFGDAKLLAVLLRRAKKRCRPLWRKVTTVTFRSIFILTIVYMVWFFSGRPVISTDYVAEFNRMARPEADESLNAAPLYVEAIMRYEQLSQDDNGISNLLSKKPGESTPEEKLLIEKWLSDNEDIPDLIVAGSKKQYCWFKYETSDDALVEPVVNFEYLKGGYSLCWRAFLKAEAGRFDEAMDDLRAYYRFGGHLKSDISLISQIIGMTICSEATEVLRNLINEYEIDSQLLLDFQNDFKQNIAKQNFLFNLKAERLGGIYHIQKFFTDDGLGNGHLYLIGMIKSFSDVKNYFNLIISGLLYHPNKNETLESHNKFIDYYEELALKTPAQIYTEQINVLEESNRIIEGNMFLSLGPTLLYRGEFQRCHRSKTDTEATLIIVALTRYEQDTGRYPDNLEQLVETGYLEQIPIDPFSDKPFAYTQKGDDFILYSYGVNCIDDGGQQSRNSRREINSWGNNGDEIFWPVQ